ncbi:chlorocatechol-degradation protein [Mycena rebaudengoi]|nr:chlorocatechol-degradation protein [Mycena rebaudengoi]
MHISFALPILFFTAVQSVVVPLVDTLEHFHSAVPNAALPQGKNVTINGVLTYVSLPQRKFDPSVAVLLLTDVFGLPSPDNLLLADEWAAAGFATYAPDYLNGDAIAMGGNTTTWIVNHGEAQTTPPLLAVISALKTRGVRKIAATGYCFGGNVAHPSRLSVPTDFELLDAVSHVPLEINNAELDTGFTPTLAVQADAVMASYEPGFLRRQFNGVAHGFAVRADPLTLIFKTIPVQVAAKQGAFDTSLAWFKKHLKC